MYAKAIFSKKICECLGFLSLPEFEQDFSVAETNVTQFQ